MLDVENISLAYGDDILFSGLSIHVAKGEIVCISGESGRGKTSLLNAVMGFVPLREGQIMVDGLVLNAGSVDIIRRKIAWIPQELALPSEWVKEMVQMPFELKANKRTLFSKQYLFSDFSKLGLDEELYEKRVSEISGGQRQRIMIAVAAMLNKPLIIVDEPTSALDAQSTEKVLSYFRSLTKEGTAVLSVSHDSEFIEGCDKKIVLE